MLSKATMFEDAKYSKKMDKHACLAATAQSSSSSWEL